MRCRIKLHHKEFVRYPAFILEVSHINNEWINWVQEKRNKNSHCSQYCDFIYIGFFNWLLLIQATVLQNVICLLTNETLVIRFKNCFQVSKEESILTSLTDFLQLTQFFLWGGVVGERNEINREQISEVKYARNQQSCFILFHE